MNKQGYTLIELVISIMIFIVMLLIFFYVLKNTILFVNLYKQETVLLNNLNIIKLKINENFQYDNIKLLRVQDLSSTGVYSIKDTVVNNQKMNIIDTIALEYEDKTSSGGFVTTQTGIFVLGVVTGTEGKLIVPPSSESGFFTIKYLSNTENLFDYTTNNTGIIVPSSQDYINMNVKIREFRYSLVNSGAYLRIDMSYDNDIDGDYEKIGQTDEYYFSGSTYLLKKIDLK
ncbi:type II secretion system protein [Candidatus Gracilibacteria bacterium]|nr:type II secretion system protein [Candidatus Gracilibacteria bacterium]PIQ11480.1 MAG: hypothetical protein COW68_02700 [Candidatus Gracilibacteria bacterium CG18_big_fil_WC_8_21_14_2_50_38_16]PIQ41770.1 MAG: hypothetical protein COW06_01840 [Candidatus Gracilibacteria bacterium CG12_big_fil_rev_8_21_14_0_65_38_15]PIZ01597.1 MAG: hypothetical protein COY60_02665 [Candidatus Gracilibacteria bacterium CG_4_10_14_0_8_um_filter_38_28]